MTRHLYLLMTILMVLSAVACDGDGGSSIDIQIDDNVDDDGNNGLDDDNNQTGQRPCGDVPHEGVIDEGEAGECGGFANECEIKGVAVRVALVCDDGQEVEITIEEACERDTNGLVVDEGEAGECNGFDDACDETGLTQRTQVVCQGGTTVEEVVEEECERDTDGVVVEEGDAGECGGFEDTCDETGIQTRTDVVCQDGQQAEVTQDVECERDTDGVVIEEGQFGECEGFEDTCDETGVRTQVTVVCRGGQQAEESLTQPCERDTDGIVLEEGQAGECGGFEGICDQTGTAERTDTVCQDGEAAPLAVAVDCQRDTNGQVVREGEPGQCGGFEGACDEEGQAQRTDVVCQDGQETEVTTQQACERDTDGVVVEEGQQGECGGFEGVCDEDGTAQRTDVVCQGGQETDVTNTVECSRDTDRLVVEEGEFGQCGGFEGPCATDGVQRRTQTICQDGQPTQEEDFQDCQRDTDGVVVEEGELGVCSGFEGICDETGTQRQTNTVCENGAPTAQDVTVECERDTDGVIVEEGQVGECGGFEGACGEEGVAQVTGVICQDGQETEATTEQACFRDTDGVVVRAGEFGQCGGFEGVCGEDGVQERTDIVCDGGQETERTERQDCQRDTDGVIVDEGQFGQCGGFENDCDEDGVQVRTQVVCEAGQESRREIEQVCTRETDGLVISEDEFGACEGFENACDETGVQRRRNIECQDGQEVGQVETRDCTRDTDGVIVDEGQFGRCGGFEGVCDEDGVQVRQETFCQGGQEAQREIEQACGRDTDGVVVLVGEPGECGGFEGVCGEDGVQERTDIVCDGGQETERTERQDCERDTDGVIVDAGQFGECGGFEGACDETGTQRRTQVVCQSGREVERADSQDCERDTDGVVIDAGQFGQCDGFEGRCDETGTQERTQVVCRDGQQAQRVENRDCARDTDGVVVEEGQFGQCGGFGDACDETGVQERALVVCRDGQQADQIDRQDCERDTDGVVVDEGQFGRCGGFEGICDETGTQTRTQTICRGGQANEEDIAQACERDTDGIVVEAGPFGECGGFGGICDETGTQERTSVVCQGGQETDEVERRECERDTDGVVVEEGQFGQCGGFEGRCDETGTQTRTDIVCRGGEQAEITQSQDCARDTDGIVIQTGQFGECGGFVDVCDETGTQTRTNIVCEGGQETEDRQTQDCARDTDGVVVEEGQFGRCEGFEGRCGEEGTQSRTNTVCRDGQQTEQTQTEACFRDTDGAVVSVGEPGECGGFEDPCDEEGVAERTDVICRDGQETEVTAEEACERDTDGTIVDEGQFGECSNFEGRCGEEGTQTRLQLICRDGAQTEVPNTEVCFRDTDGVIVEAGQFGRCQGFQDACDETGTQTRTNIVCEGGQETEARQTQDCERDTDGVVVDEGQFGECGGFEDRCDETGTQSRTSVICRGGQQTPQTQTQDCARDTDGIIIDEGQFGECGGFEDRCDEEGVQTRTQTVCRGGQAAEQTQSEVCFRDTDGVIVNQGQFNECGGFEDACDETGTQSRDVAICRDGQVAGEVQTQDCERDTDGVIVDQGQFNECSGFEDTCDETGTQSRDVAICRDGQVAGEVQTQDCVRDTDGVIVQRGQPGRCGGFEDQCDEEGVAQRTDIVCRGGQETEQTQQEACFRDTDGVVIPGAFGQCGGFEDTCDETGTQTRINIVCDAGQAFEQRETQNCTRDTDGVIVNQGQFGQCGGFENVCDETGTQSRDVVICRGGEASGEVQTQDCERDTDGVIVDTTPFGECGGFDDECDETGTQTRRVTSCRQGQPVTASESQDCTRQVEGCEEPKRCENDDQFESNEDFEEASFIEAGATSAFLCRTDFQQTQEADFYRFTVPENALLDVQVRYDHGVAPFLGIVLYGPGGQNDVRDFLFPDFEDPNTDVLQGERPIPVGARSAGEWFLEISGTEEGQDLDYEIILTIEFEEPPPQNCDNLGQDIWEANDSCRTATRLPLDLDNCRPGSAGCTCNGEQACDSPLSCVSGVCQTGFICGPSQDEDHFLVTVNEGQDLTIRLPHFHFDGNIDMEVYEPDFQTLAGFSYNAGPNFEEVTIEGAVGGDYCIRIFSLSNFTTNSYSIETNTGIRQ